MRVKIAPLRGGEAAVGYGLRPNNLRCAHPLRDRLPLGHRRSSPPSASGTGARAEARLGPVQLSASASSLFTLGLDLSPYLRVKGQGLK